MKEIKVIESNCIGCGACVALDAEHFNFNDSGLSEVISNENLESTDLQSAIDACPTTAIIVDGADSEESGCNCNTCDKGCNCQE